MGFNEFLSSIFGNKSKYNYLFFYFTFAENIFVVSW